MAAIRNILRALWLLLVVTPGAVGLNAWLVTVAIGPHIPAEPYWLYLAGTAFVVTACICATLAFGALMLIPSGAPVAIRVRIDPDRVDPLAGMDALPTKEEIAREALKDFNPTKLEVPDGSVVRTQTLKART